MSEQSNCNKWIVETITNNLAEDVNLALKKLNNLMGSEYKAIAQLATQPIEGTNYIVLAERTISQNPLIKNKIIITFHAKNNASDISDIEIHSIQQLPHKCTSITICKNQKIDISNLISDIVQENSQENNNSTISNEWDLDPNGWELDFFAAERPKEVDSAIDELNKKDITITYKAIAYLGKQDFKDSTKGINYAITAEQAIGGEKNIVLVIFNVKNDIINISHNIKILTYNNNTNTFDITSFSPFDNLSDAWDQIKSNIEKIINTNSVQTTQNNEYPNNEDQLKNINWMATIAETTPVNKLSIPGTHDTLTWDISFTNPRYWITAIPPVALIASVVVVCIVPITLTICIILIILVIIGVILYYTRGLKYSQTQNKNLNEQLEYGCRYIDIRIDEKLQGCHGKEDFGATCKYNLNNVMEDVKKFLEQHSNEVIIMRIKNDRGNPNSEKIKKIIQQYNDILWKNKESEEKKCWPLIKDVRGKIIILDSLDDYNFHSEGYGFKYPCKDGDDFFYKPQDVYENPSLEDKEKYIKNLIDTTDYEGKNQDDPTIAKMKINHVSATGLLSKPPYIITSDIIAWTPRDYTKDLNPFVVKLLQGKKCTTGLLIFDYIDNDIANDVISTNKDIQK